MGLRIGIVGAGRMGHRKARLLKAFPDVKITAVAEPNRPSRDAFKRAFGVDLAVSDHRRLASDPAVDAVYICSPPATHAPIAVDCLNSGKHVICMPPIATTIQDANEALDAGHRNGKKLFVALPQRYDPVSQWAFKLIEADGIGYPFLAQSRYLENEYRRLNDWHDWKGTWDPGGGGILMEHGSEMVDLLRYLFGDVDAVSAICTRFAVEALNKAEDSCLLDMEFLAEASVQLALSGAIQFVPSEQRLDEPSMYLEIYGLSGAIRISNTEPRLIVSNKQDRHLVIPLSEMDTGLPTDMERDFIDCILYDRQPLVTAEDAREALKVVVAGYKSSQMKRRVETIEEL